MKKGTIFILICCFILSGCGIPHCSERIELQGRKSSTFDNSLLIAPNGYFLNTYEWKDVDQHTKQLTLTLTDNKRLGEK